MINDFYGKRNYLETRGWLVISQPGHRWLCCDPYNPYGASMEVEEAFKLQIEREKKAKADGRSYTNYQSP